MFGGSYFGPDHKVIKRADELTDEFKALILHGGADITPSFYGEKVSRADAAYYPSARDRVEKEITEKAIEMGIPILGICRGAQLLCALGGGKLFQHVDCHQSGSHSLIYNGETIRTNSVHHQMMIPTDDMEILGYTPCMSPWKWREVGQVKDEGDEPEIVYFPNMKALGVQGHPEWLGHTSDLTQVTFQLFNKLFNIKFEG